MAAGFARIPTVEQTVNVPSVPNRPRPPLLDIPEQSTAGLTALSRGADQLSRVIDIQAQHKQILDGDAAATTAKTQYGVALEKIKTQYPADQWGAQFNQQAGEITKNITSDPANSHIAGYLQTHLPKLQQQMLGEAQIAGVHQNAIYQDNQLSLMGTRAANEAANMTDPAVQDAIRNGFQGKVNAIWPNSPPAAAAHMLKYDNQFVTGTAARLAGDATKGPELAQWLNDHPANFTPAQKTGFIAKQTEAMNAPVKEWDANQALARAHELQYQDQYIQQHGQPDVARLTDARTFNRINDFDFTHYTGMQYERPTPDATKALYENRIADIKNASDGDALKGDLHAAGMAKEMNGGDVAKYVAAVDDRIREIKTPAGQADINAQAQIDRAYNFDYSTSAGRIAATRFGKEAAQLRQQAKMAYKAAVFGKPGDPTAYYKAAREAVERFPMPVKATTAPATSAAPPTLSPAEVARILAAAKGANLSGALPPTTVTSE